MTGQRTWRRRLLALALGLVASAVLLEFGVRTYDKLTGQGFLSGQRNVLARAPRQRQPFRQFGADLYATDGDGRTLISSSRGERFPLQKPEGSVRIVVFGGSTTYNEHAYQAEGIHYPAVLQRLLRERTERQDIEVISTAFPAYSTAHSLVLLELDVLSWDPDIVILSHNVNDLSAAYWPGFKPDYSHKYSHPVYMGGERAEDWTVANVLFQHSQAYWFLADALARFLSGGAERATGIRRQSLGPLPDPRASASFERNLRSFVTAAQAAGIDVVLGTQPLHGALGRFSDHMADKAYKDIVVYPLHEESVLHHAHYNDILRRVADATSAGLADNALRMDDVDAYFVDHVHYTPEGVRVLAEGYADVLLRRCPTLLPVGDAVAR